MTSTTKFLTKTLMLAATLTLAGACDAEPEAADFGAGDDVELRPTSGIKLNTNYIGGFEFSELDTNFGTAHKDAILKKVCVVYKKDPICLDEVWVSKGTIEGRKNTMQFKGKDFLNSRWYLKLDYNHDGVMDSDIETTITAVTDNVTPVGDAYYGYVFAYDSKTAAGLIKKYIEQSEKPTPTCEVDVDTGSLEAVAIGDLTIDTKSGDMDFRKTTIQLACVSSATGKTPTWGYLYHKYDHKIFETMVRMVRLDACGDGTSFTEPGQKLQVEDDFGINAFADAGAKDEAYWVVGGAAACVRVPRVNTVTYLDIFNHCGIPACDEGKTMADYGASFHTKIAP